MAFNNQDVYTAQDMIDEYAGMLSSEQAIAASLGYEGKETKETVVVTSAATNGSLNTPLLPISPAGMNSLTKVLDKVPFEIWAEIVDEFLPTRGTIIETTLRNTDQKSIHLSKEETRLLSPLLHISKRLCASVVSMIFGRCIVSIHQDSVIKSLRLLRKSQYLNSPETGYGLGCVQRMVFKWTPKTAWDEIEVNDFFQVLAAAKSLVSLKFFIPHAWWEWGKEHTWKKQMQLILANNPDLEFIELWTYQPMMNLHTGWNRFFNRTWMEIEAGTLKMVSHVGKEIISKKGILA